MTRWPQSGLCCIVMSLVVAVPAFAGTPLKGVNVKLGKNPGGGAAARTTTDDKGAFSFQGLAPGSYTLQIDPCGATDAAGTPKPNPVVRYVLDHPGTTGIAVSVSGPTCALSDTLPLQGKRAADGTVTVFGVIPVDLFASGVTVDVEVNARGVMSGTLAGVP